MATLSLERQKAIENIVDDVKIKSGLSYPEQDLAQFAKQLQIKVFEFDFSTMKGNENVNGITQWYNSNGDWDPAIWINSKYSPQRKAFTLAHELGHFILHKGDKSKKYRVDAFDYSADDKGSLEESEANFFAACLLVPKEKLGKVLSVAGNDLNAIANYFGVSIPMIETRLRWLKTNNPPTT